MDSTFPCNTAEEQQTICQTKAIKALDNIRDKATRYGFLSDDEINNIISSVRTQEAPTD